MLLLISFNSRWEHSMLLLSSFEGWRHQQQLWGQKERTVFNGCAALKTCLANMIEVGYLMDLTQLSRESSGLVGRGFQSSPWIHDVARSLADANPNIASLFASTITNFLEVSRRNSSTMTSFCSLFGRAGSRLASATGLKVTQYELATYVDFRPLLKLSS